jgi:hypothetical protein
MTAKRLPRPRDPVQLGKLIGDNSYRPGRGPRQPRPIDPNKDPAAVSLGRSGGIQ